MIAILRDLSIAKKFGIGVIALLLVALLLGIEIRTSLKATGDSLRDVVRVSWQQQIDARDLRKDSNLTQQALSRFVASSVAGAANDQKTALASEVTARLDILRIAFQKYESWSDLTDHERQSLSRAKANWDIYSQSARDVLDIGEDDPALATVMLGGTNDEFDATTRDIIELIDAVYKRVGDTTDAVLNRASKTQDVLAIGGLAFALLICLVSVILHRLVLAPVGSVTNALSALLEGSPAAPMPDIRRKDEIGQMIRAIRRFRAEMETEKNLLSHLVRHDTLTGLPNRFSFTEHLEVRRARLEQTGQGFAVMLIDLDRFKIINDTMGHPAGDELLKQVAIRLRLVITDGDFVSRLGGDEFAAILSDPVNCANFARRLGEELRAPYYIQGQSVTIGSSIGISVAPIHGTDTSVLMKRVDMALYRSKGNGRDTFYIFEAERDEPNAHWTLQ